MTTIIYYTDHSLPKWLENRCQRELVKAAEGKRIISVGQKPMTFGYNICLGDIGRSHHSLFTQAITGARAATTKYIAMAEHDCMYAPEHFNWIPTDDGVFWYNVHHWFVQLDTGEYSYTRRRPMSMLICERELFIRAVEEKILMLETGFEIAKGVTGACEPGVCDNRQAFVTAKENWIRKNGRVISGEPGVNDSDIKEVMAKWDQEHGSVDAALKDVGKEEKWTAGAFKTELPNLDIRHGGNFSGGRKQRQVAQSLPYWGNFKDYLYYSL